MKLARYEANITLELIYSKISDYDIYRYFLNTDIKIGVAFCNPLRRDRSPSMCLYVGQSGHLFHKDYADERFRGGPFDLIMQMYPGIDLNGALRKVAGDFGITDQLSEEYKKITSQYVKPTIDMKKHALIQVSVKKWGKVELDYWGAYGITQEQLRAEDVYNVKSWCLNRRSQFIGKDELCFAYRFDEGFKIYYPTRQKKGEKWFSNVGTSIVENSECLECADKVLITKSRKDRMCLQNLFPELKILSVQNETRSCFTEAFVNQLKEKEVYINYDSDEPGVKACKAITEEFGFKYINIPKNYLPVKDFADLYREQGAEPIIKYFKQKGLI